MTLQSRNLTIGYTQEHSVAVENLKLNPYDVISLQGKNGSGKSTFLKTLTGFIPPLSGALLWNHQPFKLQTKKRILLPQQPVLLKSLTVEEHISLMIDYHGKSPLLKDILELCQLNPILRVLSDNLSAGQKRALGLACAALCRPILLALDEPTHELDTQLQSHVHKLIQLLSRQGTLILFSTHQAQEAQLYAKQLIIKNNTLTLHDTHQQKGLDYVQSFAV